MIARPPGDDPAALTEPATRREQVAASEERLSLRVNASLVVVALAAVLSVGGLVRRERRLTRALRRRLEEEAALRRLARALGAAATTDEVMWRVVEGAAAISRI